MAAPDRPLSPHLQVYRPEFTSVLSILHRLTGVVLGLGALALVWWLAAAAAGPEAYQAAADAAASWPGRLFLLGWTVALFFHLLNGVRHLCWDAGWGFELGTAYVTGWLVLLGTLALTLIAWLAGYGLIGGSGP